MPVESDNPIEWYVHYIDPDGERRMRYRTREDAERGALVLRDNRQLESTPLYVKSSDGQCISFEDILSRHGR